MRTVTRGRQGQTVTSWMSFHLQRKPREEPELQQALTWCPSLSHGLAAGRSLRGGEGRGRGSRGCGVAWAQRSGDGGRTAGCRESCWTGCSGDGTEAVEPCLTCSSRSPPPPASPVGTRPVPSPGEAAPFSWTPCLSPPRSLIPAPAQRQCLLETRHSQRPCCQMLNLPRKKSEDKMCAATVQNQYVQNGTEPVRAAGAAAVNAGARRVDFGKLLRVLSWKESVSKLKTGTRRLSQAPLSDCHPKWC